MPTRWIVWFLGPARGVLSWRSVAARMNRRPEVGDETRGRSGRFWVFADARA